MYIRTTKTRRDNLSDTCIDGWMDINDMGFLDIRYIHMYIA